MWFGATDGGASRKSVLVVEDDDDIRTTLESVLRDHGFDVASCANGRDALTRLQSGALSDVIILDLMMPVMDGWQFRVEQKRIPELARIPVIAVTADRTAKAVAIDADACLTKPVDMNVLLATIDRIFLMREREMIRARLVEADRLASLGTLAAGVAHEINNPLAYVMANVELISLEIEGRRAVPSRAGAADSDAVAASRRERLHDALAQVRDGLERIRTIVSDLKTFSSPAAGGLATVDVRRVLDSSANIVMNEVKHRARLIKDYEDVPLIVANESRLGQVFMNLIVNAAQSLPEESGAGLGNENEIRLVTRTAFGSIDSGESGRIVVIEVHDTGSGIPDDIVGHIFEPFFTTKPLGVGTGLGLSICHGIVSGLGGKLSVRTVIGKGSVFRIELPPASEAAVQSSKPPRRAPAPHRGRVLVVDDEEMICRTFDSLLGAEHEVTALTSARAALGRIAGGERFDLILSDLMMPDMSGIDLHGEINRIAPDQAAKMVFLTGGAFTPAARAFTDATKNTVIEKPFDWSALLELVRQRVGS